MKLVVTFFRHVLTPFTMIFAVIAGLLAAGVSGLVEFSVLQQWLRPENQRLFFIPLIVVFALEGFKLFLHFSEAAFRQNPLSNADRASLQTFLSVLPYIKWGLVAFSLVCTLIFMSSSFYYKVPGEEAESVQTVRERIEAAYSRDEQTAIEEADRIYQNTIDAAFLQVQAAQDHFDAITIVYTPRNEYVRSTEAKEAARQALQTAQQEYALAQSRAEQARIDRLEVARQALDAAKAQELEALEQSELALISGDNQYLSSFLLFFSQTFFNRTYSRPSYYIWVVTISIVLSALLEAVISLSQRVITLPPGAMSAISEGAPIDADGKERVARFLQYLTGAVVALAIFLMYGGLMEISYNKIHLGAALVCSLVAVLIPSVIFRGVQPEQEESGIKRFFQKVAIEAQTVTVKGLLSFAGFMLIGMFFGETFASLSVSAIGISIGNIIGHTLHLLPVNGPMSTQA